MKTIIEKGIKYKRIKKFRKLKQAEIFLDNLKKKNAQLKSKRFQPFIDHFWMPWTKKSRRGIMHFDVYVPMEW